MGNYTIVQMFENPRRGRQARHFTTNVLKIPDLKSSSEEIFSTNCHWVPLLSLLSDSRLRIDHFTVVVLVPQPSSECEADGDLVLIQTSFALLWKLSWKNTSQHKNNLIYIIKQEGLYQNKVSSSLAFTHNCKMAF